MSTYELTNEYAEAFNFFAETDELDQQTIDDTLEALEGPIKDKLLGWLKWRSARLAQAQAMREAAKAMNERAKAVENEGERSKQSITTHMIKTGLNKIEDAEISLKLGKASKKVRVDDESIVPSDFIIEKTVKSVDKKTAALVFKEGDEIPGLSWVDGDMRFIVK